MSEDYQINFELKSKAGDVYNFRTLKGSDLFLMYLNESDRNKNSQ